MPMRFQLFSYSQGVATVVTSNTIDGKVAPADASCLVYFYLYIRRPMGLYLGFAPPPSHYVKAEQYRELHVGDLCLCLPQVLQRYL